MKKLKIFQQLTKLASAIQCLTFWTTLYVYWMQALCAVLEYELCPSGDDKLDVMTTLHRTNVGKQRQSEVTSRLRLLKELVCTLSFSFSVYLSLNRNKFI